MISQNQKNFVSEPFRAINSDNKKWLLVFLFVFFLIVGKIAFAIPPFAETFETYDIGNLIEKSQGNWLDFPLSDDFFVESVETYEGIRAISCISDFCGDHRVGTTPSWLGSWSLKMYFIGNSYENNQFSIFLGADTTFPQNINWLYLDFTTGEFYTSYFGGTEKLGDLEFNKWLSTEIQWNLDSNGLLSLYRVRYEGVWSNWLRPLYYSDNPTDIQAIFLRADTRATSTQPIIIDYIVEPPPLPQCDFYNCNLCYTETECFLAGCNWNIETEICEPQPFGECGIKYNLRFCETQEECETFGGYWVANFCWETEPPSIYSWEAYYSEHSKFATPTSMIASLVNLTAPILETTGGWLVALESIFNVPEASQKGAELGEAIPTARGYLATINNFLGGFPISEAFILFIVITIAIGVFRIIRNIIALIKPF